MKTFEVRKLEPFGVELLGFDARSLADGDGALDGAGDLRALFDEHGLVVCRDVDLDFPAQQALVEVLVGAAPSLVAGTTTTTTGTEVQQFHVSNEVDGSYVGTGKLLFHVDAMWSDHPFELISLYGVNVHPDATPTWYVDAARAWDTLPHDLRERVYRLHAVHGEGQHVYAGDDFASHPGEQDRTHTTPVAMEHPRTGRTMLYVSEQQTRDIVDLAPPESRELLAELLAHLYSPAHTLEHHWRPGDLVAWDNVRVQHARADVRRDGPARTLRKAVVPPPWLWAVDYPDS
jgi:taurine dioxygenase